MGTFARALVGPLVAMALAACGTDGPNTEACVPGDFVRVALDDGGTGFEQCTADGGGYAPFDGDPNAPIDASAPVTACDTTPNAHAGEYMCVGCSDDSQCATGLVCYSFPSRGGGHCTRVCKGDPDCPYPANGCGTNNGHCRPQ